jgi:hypothetical protein
MPKSGKGLREREKDADRCRKEENRSGAIARDCTRSGITELVLPDCCRPRVQLACQFDGPGVRNRWCDVSRHCLLQLRIDFIRDRHNVQQ